MHVQFREFDFDPSVKVAPVIYQDQPHRVTPTGATISPGMGAELLEFIQQYAGSIGAGLNPYFRLDVYIRDDKLWVLEVNTAFVDGWGVALNLSRAAKAPVGIDELFFPRCFGMESSDYRPELELLIEELRIAGRTRHHICTPWSRPDCRGPVYVYGRDDSALHWPENGWTLDNKLNLAWFSELWEGELVMTPKTYSATSDWADVPDNVFLKFVDKGSPEAIRAGFSVMPGKPAGKAPFIRRCYNAGDLIAQERVYGMRLPVEGRERQVQLVVLSNAQMLTGYVQYGAGIIVNDNSIHGPLIF